MKDHLKRIIIVAVSILSLILLRLSVPQCLIFLGFAVLFEVNSHLRERRIGMWLLFLGNLILLSSFSILIVHWLVPTNFRIVYACLIYSAFFTLPYIIFAKRSTLYNLLGFVALWLVLEHLFTVGPLAFPYLALGNLMVSRPDVIQWYEYTGVAGGSAWILIINMMILYFCNNHERIGLFAFCCCFFIIAPFLISKKLDESYKKPINDQSVEVIALHSNIDVYNQKYRLTPEKLVDIYFETLGPLRAGAMPQLIVWPETAITGFRDISKLDEDTLIASINRRIKNDHNGDLISGALFKEVINTREDINRFAHLLHYNETNNYWYLNYNAALAFDSKTEHINTRTKQKLVPFEETLPYPDILSGLQHILPSLGKFLFTSKQQSDHIFTFERQGVKAAPMICYESLFSGYTASMVDNGANLIVVMLNESWYSQKDLVGAEQFKDFSVLRAIENRRSVVRSSNGGVTCLIDPSGKIFKRISGPNGYCRGRVLLNSKKTFYSQHRNCTFSVALICLIFIGTYGVIKNVSLKRK